MRRRLDKRIRHNAIEVRKYLEYHAAIIEVSGRGEVQVRASKEKGTSRLPVPNNAIAWFENAENREASSYLRRRIESLRITPTRFRGVFFSSVIEAIYNDPGVIRRWKSHETEDDELHDTALWKMCLLVSYSLPGHLWLSIKQNPRTRLARSYAGAAQSDRWQRAREQEDYERWRDERHRQALEEAHRRRYSRLIELEVSENLDRASAIQLLSETGDDPIPKIRDAIAYMESERHVAHLSASLSAPLTANGDDRRERHPSGGSGSRGSTESTA